MYKLCINKALVESVEKEYTFNQFWETLIIDPVRT